MKKFLLLAIALMLALVLVSCGGGEAQDSTTDSTPGTTTDSTIDSTPDFEPEPDPKKESFTGITFENVTLDYDGKEHEITVSGTLPEGATVTYTGNKGTNAGEYKAKAVITKENYNTLELTATLKINKLNFTGLTFEGATIDYDGKEHEITVSGTLPEGATVTYTGNKGTNAGEYKAKAVITKANYNDLELSATLKIKKINLLGFTFENGSFEYDGLEHTITVSGNVPAGVSVIYTGGENSKNGATGVGKYEITATISGQNYNTLVLKATLQIKSTEELLAVHVVGNKVYFQNALDSNTLYTYDTTGLKQVSTDVTTSIISEGGRAFYVSKGLLSSTIGQIDGNGEAESLLGISAESIISDGTYLYYNVNSLISAEKTGIYKVKISDLTSDSIDATPTKLTSVKSDWLVYAQGYIYFSNKSAQSKLYAISVNASNAEPKLIYNYKVTDIITDGSKLYFTRDITLSNLSAGAAIYSINVSGGLSTEVTDDSNKVVKITMSKGKYLTKIGDYIYFLNTDMATSTIFGDGIYKAKADGSGWIGDTWQLLTGASKVLDASTDNVYSLSTDGYYLYYFRASTKHLYRYNLNTGVENDLMQGFVPVEKQVVITTYYEKAISYNGEIYYINMRDGGKLYKYNPTTKGNYRITGMQVADFAINDGYLYYTTVKLLVNFDLYRMSLLNGEPELISADKCMNLSFNGGKIYYTNYRGSNTLNRMNLDGTEDEIIFDEETVGSGETTVYDGYVYFFAKDLLYRYSIAKGTSEVVNKNLKPLEYLIYNGKILLMNCDGFQNHIDIYDIATGKSTNLGNLGISGISDDVRGMFVYGGELYFYRNVAAGSKNKGLYKVSGDKAVLVATMDGYYMCETVVVNGKVYFLDVWQVKDSIPTPSSTAKIFKLDMNSFTVTEQ